MIRFHLRTLVMLCVFALVAVSYEYYTHSIRDDKSIATIINKAGKQRMYSQRIAFLADIVIRTHDSLAKKELMHAIDSMRSSHHQLLSIRNAIAKEYPGSEVIDSIYFKKPDTLDHHIITFIDATEKFVFLSESHMKEASVYAEYIRTNARGTLLNKLDKAVNTLSAVMTKNPEDVHWFDKFDLPMIVIVICVVWLLAVFPFNKKLTEEMKNTEDVLPRLHLLSFVAEKTQNTVIIANVNGEILWVNPAFTRLTGFTLDEVLGKRPGSLLFSKNTDEKVIAEIAEAMKNKMPYSNEILNITKDGREYWTQLHIDPIFDENNVHTGFLSVEFDITEHRAAEKKVSATAELLEQLMENILVGVLVEDEHRKVAYVNSSLCNIFQLTVSPKEVIGGDCVEGAERAKERFVNPEEFIIRINELIKNREAVFDELLMLSDGRFFERTYVPIEPNEGVEWSMWLYRDVTQRKLSEEALRKSESTLQRAHLIAKLASFETPADGKRDYWSSNPGIAFGFTEGVEFQNVNLKKLVTQDVFDKIVSAWMHAIKTGVTFDMEFPVVHPDGSVHYSRCIGEPVFDDKGTYVKMLGIVQDITEKKLAELETLKAKEESERANRAKSAFLSSMTHELRTPLNAIIGFSQILQQDTSIPQKQREFISAMYNSGQHLLVMINDVLDMSKIEADKLEFQNESLSLNELLDDMVAIFSLKAAQKNINFYVIRDTSLPKYVLGDKKRLKQVCINLIGNSVKFTQKGFIEFSIKKIIEIGEDEGTSVDVMFSVKDTGKGIPEERIPNIFEPFSQVEALHSEGTGLGLAISSRIVQEMGGTMSVKSEVGKGSEFSFSLRMPVIEKPLQMLSRSSDFVVTGLKGERKASVLLVDDIESNLLVHKALLRRVGFDCVMAQSADEAIAVAKSFSPDIIITDIMMPEKNGIELLKEIRSEEWGKRIPVIALTANAQAYNKDEMIAYGFNEFIVKPFRMEKLFESIEHCSDIRFQWEMRASSSEMSYSEGEQVEAVAEFIASLQPEVITKITEAIEYQFFDKIEKMLLELPLPETEKLKFGYEYLLHGAKDANFAMMIKLTEMMAKES